MIRIFRNCKLRLINSKNDEKTQIHRLMKKIQILTLIILFFGSGLIAQSGKSARYVKPVNFQKKVTTIVSGKSRSYYSLNNEIASVINLRGPGVLRIITRARFAPGKDGTLKYEIKYTVDGGEMQSKIIANVKRTKNATYKNGSLGMPGQLRDFEIELDRGDHTIELFLKDVDTPVAVRYKFTPTKAKKQDWIAFCPLRPSEPVDLISRESTVKYYRFSMEKPVKVELTGPTQLRVLSRIENHYHMKGRINYRLQVVENGEVKNTYQLSSRRSEIAVYKNDKDIIPGKACEFVINVPQGKHIYEIKPLDKNKSTVLGRFLLPEKDVQLGQ